MSKKTNTAPNGVSLDLTIPFTMTKMPNGGYLLEQQRSFMAAPSPTPFSQSPQAPAPAREVSQSQLVGAYSSAADMLAALALMLDPPEPERETITETPPFDATNHPDEWMSMDTAPRTGIYVRIQDEEGNRHRPMKYTHPGWWDGPNGELRLADPLNSSDANVMRAAKWRPLAQEENVHYNGRKPTVPAWGRQ